MNPGDSAASMSWLVGGIATVVANLALGWITLLPARFVVFEVSVTFLGEVSTDYNSDPGFFRFAAIASGILIPVLFGGVNLAVYLLAPGRHKWIWALALVTYPIPCLIAVSSH